MSENTFPPTPTANYVDQQNINYGLFNSKGQFLFSPSLNISGEYVSPATLPQFPIRAQGDASQLTTNANNKSVFAALNAQSRQVACNTRSLNRPIFKSYREQLAYIQGQYTQAIPGTTSMPTYSINTLFNPQFSCVNYTYLIQLNAAGANFDVAPPAMITGLTFPSSAVLNFQVVNGGPVGTINVLFFSLTGFDFTGTIAKIENQVVPTQVDPISPSTIQVTPILSLLQSYSIITLILPSAISTFTQVGLNRTS